MSNYSVINWAEGLIRQLPETHDGRNSWLMNYSLKKDAQKMRDEHPKKPKVQMEHVKDFKKGDKIRVYDSIFASGFKDIVLDSDFTDKQKTVETNNGIIWIHLKQCELIERPTQKLKLYQYAWLSKGCEYKCTAQFFKDDVAFLCWLGITSTAPFKRLDYTMIEVGDEQE